MTTSRFINAGQIADQQYKKKASIKEAQYLLNNHCLCRPDAKQNKT